MKFAKEFYENLTAAELEENIEFIDWLLVPDNLLTDELANKFSCFLDLRPFIWFKLLLKSLEIKISEEKFPNEIFLFKGKTCYLNYNKENMELWISEEIWRILNNDYKFSYIKIQQFISYWLTSFLKVNEVIPKFGIWGRQYLIHEYFIKDASI